MIFLRNQLANDVEACTGCQDCIVHCQLGALSMKKFAGQAKLKAAVDAGKCMGCGVCMFVCGPRSLTKRPV